LKIRFEGDLEATLPTTHPDFDLLRSAVEWSVDTGRPVGFVLEGGDRIVALNHSYDSSIRSVGDDPEDGSRIIIGFWAYCSICYLTRDHPDFERILGILREAATAGRPVVFVIETWPIEGETEIWAKIMDVRPLPVPAPAKETNGAAAVTARESVPQTAANPER
jgi:hypothetical protein